MSARVNQAVEVWRGKQLVGRGILRRYRTGGYWVEGYLDKNGITAKIDPVRDEVLPAGAKR